MGTTTSQVTLPEKNKPTEGSGPDNIPGHALRVGSTELADVLADIYNLTLAQTSVPPLQFAYCQNRSTDNVVNATIHTALIHLDSKNTYVH